MKKKSFMAAVNVMTLVLILFQSVQLNAGDEVVADPDPGRFSKAMESFAAWDMKNSCPDNAVLFVGSSSIRMWMTTEFFPDFKVINRGFGGSHISDVNHFAEKIVLKYSPELIVFYAGDNDIAYKKTPEQVLEDFQEFVELTEKKIPGTPIIFIPIKPSLNRWHLWDEMVKANRLIEDYSSEKKLVRYVDMASPMLTDNGKPGKDLFIEDGLHLSKKGYDLWTSLLKPVIEGILKERSK